MCHKIQKGKDTTQTTKLHLPKVVYLSAVHVQLRGKGSKVQSDLEFTPAQPELVRDAYALVARSAATATA